MSRTLRTRQLILPSTLMLSLAIVLAGGPATASGQTAAQPANDDAAPETFSKSRALAGYAVLSTVHSAKDTSKHSKNSGERSRDAARASEAILRSNEELIRSNEAVARSNEEVIRSNEAVARSNEAVARSNEALMRSKEGANTAVGHSRGTVISPGDVAAHSTNAADRSSGNIARTVETIARPRETTEHSRHAVAPVVEVVSDDASSSRRVVEVVSGSDVAASSRPTMLDRAGHPIVDPFGKPVYQPVAEQLRDKKGRPVFNKDGEPVLQSENDMGYDSKGKKIRAAKPGQHLLEFTIKDGSFSVDHLPVLSGLNYRINSAPYLYVYAPGFGVAIISADPFPGAIEEAGAFEGRVLAIRADHHTFEMLSTTTIRERSSAYVLLDRYASLPSCVPVIGYGTSLEAPYAWPDMKAADPPKCSGKTALALNGTSGQQTVASAGSNR